MVREAADRLSGAGRALLLGGAALAAAALALPADLAAQGGQSYRIQLENRTCAPLKLSWDYGLACDTPDSPGCSITLGSNVSTNLNLNLERRTDTLTLTASGTCPGGSATAPARVAGTDDPAQVAAALRAADAPTRVEGTCALPLTRMFPYAGMQVQETESASPAPIAQPAPGGGFAYESPAAGDPFGPVGPWGEPAASITTTVPEITSPVPVRIALGACQPGNDGTTVCGFTCTPLESQGGLPDELPGQLDNTD